MRPLVRLSLDSMDYLDSWVAAYERLRRYCIVKANIRSYVLIGFEDDPGDAWVRCLTVESFGIKPLPMWYHAINTLERNTITAAQVRLGWNNYERRRIMQWFYQHKRAVPEKARPAC